MSRIEELSRYCRVVHKWVNPQKESRPRKDEIEQRDAQKSWREGVSYQRFFEYAQWKRVFEVQTQVQETNNPNDEAFGQELFSQASTERNEWKKKREIEGSTNRY